jgi:DNA-binding transcriptional ArsR family regulator
MTETKFVRDELGNRVEVETVRCYPMKSNVVRLESSKVDSPIFYPPPISVDLLRRFYDANTLGPSILLIASGVHRGGGDELVLSGVLCEILGLSGSSKRRAISALKKAGLIEVRPSRSTQSTRIALTDKVKAELGLKVTRKPKKVTYG